jgi:hypothetical protein
MTDFAEHNVMAQTSLRVSLIRPVRLMCPDEVLVLIVLLIGQSCIRQPLYRLLGDAPLPQ